MKLALMGKVLCASCKIERRSNVIQRLFNSSDIIAKSNFFFAERCTARVSWGIIVSSPEPSSMISFVVGMSNNFSFKHPRVVFTNFVSPQLKFIRWSTTKRVDSLSKRKKKWIVKLLSSDFLLSNLLCPPLQSQTNIFSVLPSRQADYWGLKK